MFKENEGPDRAKFDTTEVVFPRMSGSVSIRGGTLEAQMAAGCERIRTQNAVSHASSSTRVGAMNAILGTSR